MLIAMSLGYSGGVVLSYFCGQWIVFAIGGRVTLGELKRSFVGLLGIVGGLAALLPALFLATVVGGLGGGYGEVVSMSIGLGMAGVPVGLALGFCLVTAAVTSGGVLLGAGIGKLLQAMLSGSPARPSRR
jgi:hypothetical protein